LTCVTAADLGKPIAAIVERCGSPDRVSAMGPGNGLFYFDGGHGTTIWFDADQMRARFVQFYTYPLATYQPDADWNVTLPFESGAREIALGHMTLADAQGALAVDADVTTKYGAAFRSTARNDIVLASSDHHVLDTAFVGERTSLVQDGIINSQLGNAPLDYVQPVPRDTKLRGEGTGSRSTIFRIDVDAYGIARKVTIVIPSGDGAFDASTQLRLGDAKFRAATLEKRPVSGTSFVQVRH
jgi:hypothetical protein